MDNAKKVPDNGTHNKQQTKIITDTKINQNSIITNVNNNYNTAEKLCKGEYKGTGMYNLKFDSLDEGIWYLAENKILSKQEFNKIVDNGATGAYGEIDINNEIVKDLIDQEIEHLKQQGIEIISTYTTNDNEWVATIKTKTWTQPTYKNITTQLRALTENIPKELKTLKSWTFIDKNNRPCDSTSENVPWKNENNLNTFYDLEYIKKNEKLNFEYGFYLNKKLVAIDIDGCYENNKSGMYEWAKSFLQDFPLEKHYVEYSRSGKGLHIIAENNNKLTNLINKYAKSKHSIKMNAIHEKYSNVPKKCGIEFFSDSMLTITGDLKENCTNKINIADNHFINVFNSIYNLESLNTEKAQKLAQNELKYENDVFNVIKTKVTLSDVFSYYGIHYSPRSNISCPFHEDKKPSFKIYDYSNSFHCFSCNKGGSIIDFVMEKENLSDIDSAKFINDKFNLNLNFQSNFKSVKPSITKFNNKMLEQLKIVLKSQGIAIEAEEPDGITFKCPICEECSAPYKLLFESGLIISTDKDHVIKDTHLSKFKNISRLSLAVINKIKSKLRQEKLQEKVHRLDSVNIKCDENLELYMYDEAKKYYVRLSDRKLEKLIYDICEPEDRKEYNNIRGEVRNDYEPDIIMDNKPFFNLQNGVFDYENNKLIPHSKDHFFTYIIPADYNPNARSELLYNTVKQILGSDEWVLEFKKALGYSIHNTTKFEKGFMLNGTKGGSNGKDTILGLLVGNQENGYRGLFSHLSVCASITQVNDQFSHSMLENKKMLVDSDYNEKYLKNTALIRKMITGGKLEIREPHKESRNINVVCKPWIACNSFPKLDSGDGGWFRRWTIFDCVLTFGKNGAKKDPNLKSKLNTDEVYSTLFNWVLEGYDIVENYNKSYGDFFKENENAIRQWKGEVNNVIQFVDEMCILDSKEITLKRTLYERYKEYCIETGTRPLSTPQFTKNLLHDFNEFNVQEEKCYKKGEYRKKWIFLGIGLNDNDIDNQFEDHSNNL